MSPDFYAILDVPDDASDDDIRDAYRRAVKAYHPDRNDHPRAHAQFKVITKAYEVLIDPTERSAYDRLGHDAYVNNRLAGGLPMRDAPRPSSDAESESDDERSTHVSDTSDGTRVQTGGNGTSDRRPSGRQRRRRETSQSRVYERTGRGGRTDAGSAGTDGDTTGAFSGRDYTIGMLWAFVLAGFLPYALGFATFLRANSTGIGGFAGSIAAGSVGVNDVLTGRFGVETIGSFVGSGLADGRFASVALLVGIVVFPAVFAVSVYRLRAKTVWRASWMYVGAAAAPLGALALESAGISALLLDLMLYVIAPVCALVVFMVNRFVLQ